MEHNRSRAGQLPTTLAKRQNTNISTATSISDASTSTQTRQLLASTRVSVVTPSHTSTLTKSQHSVTTSTSQTGASTTQQGSSESQTTYNRNATIEMLTAIGVNFERPKHPSYAIMAVRMSSFKNGWPCDQTPKALAEAGFFFIGNLDYVRCFFCGGGLKNWEDGDDPWIEHARWFPKCVYLRQKKGDAFINLIQKISQNENETNIANSNQDSVNNSKPTPSTSEASAAEEKVSCSPGNSLSITDQPECVSSHPAYKSVKDTGYSDDQICSAIKVLQKKEMQELVEENRRLKEKRLCRVGKTMLVLLCFPVVICLAAVTVLRKRRKCPTCDAFVKGQVRTWLE